ncbi:MAG: cob(I)yrinic acid a,c-diamide adenosyltransferase [Deltaproteobacteria bacterium]
MSVVTRRGDKGKTSLFPQGIVSKDDTRIELVGTLDELASFLGVVRGVARDRRILKEAAAIQKELFWVSAEAVTVPSQLGKLKHRIGDSAVRRLEKAAAIRERRAGGVPRRFVVPGGQAVPALLHVCRALCRRAERRMVTLRRKNQLKNDALIRYMNRLSDLLFLLAVCKKRK